jgi:hypothetical protein
LDRRTMLRLYFGSQRGDDVGITYEVRGPFR